MQVGETDGYVNHMQELNSLLSSISVYTKID